jgi:hypothetical protein
MARQLQGFPNAGEGAVPLADLRGDRSTASSNKQPNGAVYQRPLIGGRIKAGKLDASSSKAQKFLKDFRHGVIRFEGARTEARFMLPPYGLEDPSLILRAMLESGNWGLALPKVVFQCDEMLYGGTGDTGGYYMQDFAGGDPVQVDWRWNQMDWQRQTGHVSRDQAPTAATKIHKSRMSSVAQCCYETATDKHLNPWFFSSSPCMGGGDGGNMITDYLEHSVQAPVFVGACDPGQGLFEEEGLLSDLGAGVSNFLGGVKSAVVNMAEGTPRIDPGATRQLPFILQACPDCDLQDYAVKLRDEPRKKFVYPDMSGKLLCERSSNLRWLNPGVSHYIFFLKSQERLHKAFVELVEGQLAPSVRIVAGPCNSPEYARHLFDKARRRKGSLTILLDKAGPLATRIAAGLRAKAGDTPRSLSPLSNSAGTMGWLGSAEQHLGAGAGGLLSGGALDLSPIDVPQDVALSCQVVPFLEDTQEQDFQARLTEVITKRLPKAIDDHSEDRKPHPDRLHRVWELATRLMMAAERREIRMKYMVTTAVVLMGICVSYAIMNGYDANFEHRPCEPLYSPIGWGVVPKLWTYICFFDYICDYGNAALPILASALVMKICLPTSLQHSRQAVWLRSAAGEIVHEIYKYRTGSGIYAHPLHKLASLNTKLDDTSSDSSRSHHITFDETIAKISERALLNTGIQVDSLYPCKPYDVKRFKGSMIGHYKPLNILGDEPPDFFEGGLEGNTPRSPLIKGRGMTYEDRDEGVCNMTHHDYLNFRVFGQRELLLAKKNKAKCAYELYWAFIIVMSVGAATCAAVRLNLTMLVCLVSLTGAMVCCDLGEVPLRLKTTSAVIRVLDDYLEQWEGLSDREQCAPAKFQALVDGVEEVLLLEDPYYLHDRMSLRGQNLYEGHLIEIPDELDTPMQTILPRSAHRLPGPRCGARGAASPRAMGSSPRQAIMENEPSDAAQSAP